MMNNTLIEVLRRDETTERMRKVQRQDKAAAAAAAAAAVGCRRQQAPTKEAQQQQQKQQQQKQQQHLSWYGVDLSLVGAVCLYQAVIRGNANLVRRLAACGARLDAPRVIHDTITVLVQQLDQQEQQKQQQQQQQQQDMNAQQPIVLQLLQACIDTAALDPQLVLYAVTRRRQWTGPVTAHAIVQLLVSRGANVNQATTVHVNDDDDDDDDSVTPLMMACRAMHAEMVTALGQQGANFAARDKVGRTCLYYTVMDDSPKAPALWNVLLSHVVISDNHNRDSGNNNNFWEMTANKQYACRHILHQAVMCLSASRLEKFLQTFGTLINRQAVDCHGWTALHYASFGGRADKVKVVLQTCTRGAADDGNDDGISMIHAKDQAGRTPLHVFGLQSYVPPDTHDLGDFVNRILSSASSNKMNPAPQPPPPRRQEPTYWQVDKAIHILLMAGANPLAIDKEGNPPWVATASLLGHKDKDDLVQFNSLYQIISVAALCGGINATILR